MDSLFIDIMNNAIVASWLIVAIIILRLVLKKVPKWIHCLLWGLVAIKLLIPVNIESPFGILPSTKPISHDITVAEVPAVDTVATGIDGNINFVLAENLSGDNNALATVAPMKAFVSVASIIWVVGIIIMLAYFIVSFLVIKRRVAASIRVASNIYECDDIVSPFILGLVSPKIYFPSGLDTKVKECVIAHENTHINRRDFLWKPLGFVVLAVYWFNPLCWISYVLLCRDIEYACDEKTTKDKDDSWRADYCQALLDCSVQRKMITACPVAFGEVSVKERIRKVINYKKPAFWGIVAALVVCAVVAVCFMTSNSRPGLFESVQVEDTIQIEETISVNSSMENEVEEGSINMLPEDETDMAQIPEDSTDDSSVDAGNADGEVVHDYDAEFVWPTDSTVVAWRFGGEEEHGDEMLEGAHTDRINIAGDIGDNVYAATSGSVTKAEFDESDGNYIEIVSGDGFHFFYYHLSEMDVNVGDAVNAGDIIGKVGSTGKCTGPNLGFSMGEQQGSEFVYLDPLNFLMPPALSSDDGSYSELMDMDGKAYVVLTDITGREYVTEVNVSN